MNITPHIDRFLGKGGAHRLEIFRATAPGWDGGGHGKALSVTSVRMAEAYCVPLQYCPNVSIFMSTEGNVLFGWDDANQKVVEIEFFAETGLIGYFQEDSGHDDNIAVPPGDSSIPYPPNARRI